MKIFLKIASLFVLATLTLFMNFHVQSVQKLNTTPYAPPPVIQHFLFGYKEVFSDSLWVRLLQDIGECEQKLNPEGLGFDQPNRIANCNKGWAYRMLDLITDISPRFKFPLQVGVLMLSVVVDDIEGASLLFEKATSRYPNDWKLHYQAGYHFLYEVHDTQKAARFFRIAAEIGAPKWVYALSAKLYSEVGRAFVGKTILEDFLKRADKTLKPGDRARIEARLKEINQQLEKETAKYDAEQAQKARLKKNNH